MMKQNGLKKAFGEKVLGTSLGLQHRRDFRIFLAVFLRDLERMAFAPATYGLPGSGGDTIGKLLGI